MAKSTGLGFTVAVDSSDTTVRDISNDVTNLSFSTPRGVQDVTGVDKSANERLLLLADFQVNLNGVFNPAANPSAHGVFSTVPSTSVGRTVTLTVQAKVLAAETLFSDYSLTRAQDGSFVWTAPGALQNGAVPTWA